MPRRGNFAEMLRWAACPIRSSEIRGKAPGADHPAQQRENPSGPAAGVWGIWETDGLHGVHRLPAFHWGGGDAVRLLPRQLCGRRHGPAYRGNSHGGGRGQRERTTPGDHGKGEGRGRGASAGGQAPAAAQQVQPHRILYPSGEHRSCGGGDGEAGGLRRLEREVHRQAGGAHGIRFRLCYQDHASESAGRFKRRAVQRQDRGRRGNQDLWRRKHLYGQTGG